LEEEEEEREGEEEGEDGKSKVRTVVQTNRPQIERVWLLGAKKHNIIEKEEEVDAFCSGGGGCS
jgi:hypothetical protein